MTDQEMKAIKDMFEKILKELKEINQNTSAVKNNTNQLLAEAKTK